MNAKSLFIDYYIFTNLKQQYTSPKLVKKGSFGEV